MAVVVRLFAAHAFADTSDEHMKIKFEVYAEALDEMPTWAIAAAQRDWCSGHVEGLGTVNFAFPPSPGQLAILARRHLFAVRCDALRLQRLLGANVANIKPSNPDMMRRLLTIVPRGGDAA